MIIIHIIRIRSWFYVRCRHTRNPAAYTIGSIVLLYVQNANGMLSVPILL